MRPPQGSAGYPDGDPGERPWNRAANFNGLNRNKLGLTLDLGDPKGADAFKELVSISDVVVSNYAYGVMTEKFGLDYETLRRVKPDIVMLLMPGFGNTGPYKRYRSMGMTIDALSGHSSQRGYPDLDLSTLSPVHHPDAVGGATAAFAVCAALHRRNRTGEGQFIDMAQAESFIPHMGEAVLEYGMTGRPRARRGNRHPDMAPHGVYPCEGEDEWIALAVRTESEWRAACVAMGAPALADDARFDTLDARLANHDELDANIADWTRGLEPPPGRRVAARGGCACRGGGGLRRGRLRRPALAGAGLLPAGDAPGGGDVPAERPHVEAVGAGRTAPRAGAGAGRAQRPRAARPAGVSGSAYAELERDLVIGDTPLEGSDMGGIRRVRREAALRGG